MAGPSPVQRPGFVAHPPTPILVSKNVSKNWDDSGGLGKKSVDNGSGKSCVILQP
jgi:hypothetical protein